MIEKLIADSKHIKQNVGRITQMVSNDPSLMKAAYRVAAEMKGTDPTYDYLVVLFREPALYQNLVKFNMIVAAKTFNLKNNITDLEKLWGDRDLSEMELGCYRKLVQIAQINTTDAHVQNLQALLVNI